MLRRWYAQHGEDRRLWRALGHIEDGHYIDIGAYEPEFHSVTKAFYDNGWSGVNVEPNPRAFDMLDKQRPRDTNLWAAIADRPWVTLYMVKGKGRSTTDEGQIPSMLGAGMKPMPIEVPGLTLASVCAIIKGDIHFLKVDVEGSEEEVLRTGDWFTYRPWVVVVEARAPMTDRKVRTHGVWEPMLLDSAYRFVYDDGLNRWYVSNESMDVHLGSDVDV